MQTLKISPQDSERPFDVKALSHIRQHFERIELLAQESPCPELKVAYILVDRLWREIAHGINGFRENGSPCTMTEDGHEDVHAEDQLGRIVVRLAIDTEDTCAIGNFSSCRDCMGRLAALGVRQIIFSNVYKDISALNQASKLGMKLWYFHDSQVYRIPREVIEWLERLLGPLTSMFTNNHGHRPSHKSDTPQTEEAYVATHEKELRILLDLLLQELLSNYSVGLDYVALASRRVAKLVCQIETEYMCLQLARGDIILTKHP